MKYEELPPRVQEYLGSHYTTLKTLRLASRYRLPKEKIAEYSTALGQVFLQTITPDQLPTALEENLKIQKGDAFLLAADSAEQHFLPYEDFLGATEPFITKWRSWAQELGARKPSEKASPEIERMVSGAGQLRGRGMEFVMKSRKNTRQITPRNTPTTSPKRTVGTKVLARKEGQDASSDVNSSQTQTSPEARQKFLGQVRGLTIESLRQPGGTAEAKLSQVAEKIQQVVAAAPNERFTVSQALRNSPLFGLYQQLGQETIRTRQPIDQVIYARYQQQQPYLLKEEFDAVAELIKQIG